MTEVTTNNMNMVVPYWEESCAERNCHCEELHDS